MNEAAAESSSGLSYFPLGGTLSFGWNCAKNLASSTVWFAGAVLQAANDLTHAELDAAAPSSDQEKDYDSEEALLNRHFNQPPAPAPISADAALPDRKIIIELFDASKQLRLFTEKDGVTPEMLADLEILCDANSLSRVERLRRTLLPLLDSNIERKGIALANAAYRTLIALAKYRPLEEIEPIDLLNLHEIPVNKVVFITSGRFYNVSSLMKWDEGKTDPTTKELFHRKDREEILRVHRALSPVADPNMENNNNVHAPLLPQAQLPHAQPPQVQPQRNALAEFLTRLLMAIIALALLLGEKLGLRKGDNAPAPAPGP